MTERVLQEVAVPVDQFEIARNDVVLAASLRSSFALCLYDEVNEAGALLHMQIGRPGRVADPELTDNTLSTNLLLLDRCIEELRHCEPRARHWQAKFIAHADEPSGGRERMLGIQSFIEAYLEDVGIGLVSAAAHTDEPLRLRFRPAMAQLHCEPQAAAQAGDTQRLPRI
jgi:chemotaxis receptor (MCP) glutamine deamidase CheD